MKAMIQHAHGGPEVLGFEDIPDPPVGETDVLIAVKATSLNRLDLLNRKGPPLLPGFRLPHIAGMDVAGEIVAVGAGVSGLAPGDRVLVNPAVSCGRCRLCVQGLDGFCLAAAIVGGSRPGGYAELCAVPSSHVYAIPAGVEYSVAATIPTAFSTAWQGLVVTGKVSIGETVLIHAAASGVSVAAIQLAKRAGARVIATAGSASKLELAERLGADVVVNNRTEDVAAKARAATDGRGVDVVFDHVGPALLHASLAALRPRGRLVFCGSTTGTTASFDLPHAYRFGLSLIGVEPYSYAEFGRMIDYYWRAGLNPVIDRIYPLSSAREAHERLACGEALGKIVLQP